MSSIKLGVIGLTPGNGHPYSWSAIFNGYDRNAMENCGFPVIPRYLEKQDFPGDAIAGARVTHVWTQDKNISLHIAEAALIPNVVNQYVDMIGHVDGVLLARDDAVNHLEFATPFLEAGLPIYIDKPLALSVDQARRILSRQQYPGQIFSCSALKYAKEFQLSSSELSNLGEIRHIHAIAPKDWARYAVHIIEPLLLLVKNKGEINAIQVWKNNDSTILSIKYGTDLQVHISTVGVSCAPLSLRIIGEIGWRDLFFQDAYSAFKSALFDFVQGIIYKDVRCDPDIMLEVVSLIEAGQLK